MRRRQAAHNWIRAEELPDTLVDPAGEHLLRMTAAQDLLVGMKGKRALLDEKLALVRSHRLDQALVCTNGSYTVERAVLHLTEGLAFRANVERVTPITWSRSTASRSGTRLDATRKSP